MIGDLLKTFAGKNIKPCLDQEDRTKFYIDDPLNGPAEIIKYEFHDDVKVLLFEVINNDSWVINFLAVDGCLIGRKQSEKCDFIVFDEQTFCFVEMKMRSKQEIRADQNDEEGINTVDTRVKAARQIVTTYQYLINQFSAVGLQFDYPQIEGLIAVPDKFPKSSSTEKKFVESFFELNNFPLFIDSQKVFS